MTSGGAEKLISRSPDEIRALIPMMTDQEIRDLMLYFRLGLLCFLDELTRQKEEAASRPEL